MFFLLNYPNKSRQAINSVHAIAILFLKSRAHLCYCQIFSSIDINGLILAFYFTNKYFSQKGRIFCSFVEYKNVEMENNYSKPNNGIGLGIAGLVLGIAVLIALPLALLGCTSVAALLIAILGVAFSTVALSQAKKVSAPTSLIMAALVVSVIALSFSALKVSNVVMKIKQFSWEIVNKNLERIENDTDNFGKIFEEEFERELGGNLEEVLRDLENELDSMEEDLDDITDEFKESIEEITDNEESARKLGRAAGRALREFVDEINDSTNVHIEFEID